MRILLTALFLALFLFSGHSAEARFFGSALSYSDAALPGHHGGHGGHGPHGNGCGR